MVTTSGLLQVHSTPSALCPHIEWAASGVLGMSVHLDWTPQNAQRGAYRTQLPWRGPVGTGALLASTFLRWQRIRFEVTEDPGPDGEGHRWSFTPRLGIFHAPTNAMGDLMVPEEQLREAMADELRGGPPLREALHRLLGTAWDEELDIFRYAGEDSPVRWLHQVG